MVEELSLGHWAHMHVYLTYRYNDPLPRRRTSAIGYPLPTNTESVGNPLPPAFGDYSLSTISLIP